MLVVFLNPETFLIYFTLFIWNIQGNCVENDPLI